MQLVALPLRTLNDTRAAGYHADAAALALRIRGHRDRAAESDGAAPSSGPVARRRAAGGGGRGDGTGGGGGAGSGGGGNAGARLLPKRKGSSNIARGADAAHRQEGRVRAPHARRSGAAL